MSGNGLNKVTPGQPLKIPATAYNAFVDAALAHRAVRSGNRAGSSSADTTGIIYVKNTSGSDLGRFSVVGLGDAVLDPATNLENFKNSLMLEGTTPSYGTHEGKFAVLTEPIAAGKLGKACLFGVTPVQINVTDELHVLADIAAGQSGYLASGETGAAQILYKQAGTGTKWAIVRMGWVAASASASGPTWIMLDGATLIDGATYRWAYQWHEVQLNEEGTWVSKDGGMSHSTHGVAYNGFEANNGATGQQGNGYYKSEFPAGTHPCIPLGDPVVPAWLVPNCHDVLEMTFSAPNMPGGSC